MPFSMERNSRCDIVYDPSAAFFDDGGLSEGELRALESKLDDARNEVLADADLWRTRETVPPARLPLDAGFHELPDRLLGDYEGDRPHSEVEAILRTARRLAELVDRVVILGIGGSYMGARALFEACCHPYHNELTRAQRGGIPRMYFEGNNLDNDAVQGLLDLLAGQNASAPAVDWGIVVISKSGGTLETAVAFRIFADALRKSLAGDEARLGARIVPVTGSAGRLADLARALRCSDSFLIPEGVGGRYSVLSAVGLLPAAILGLDVVKLLQGASAMNAHFRTAPPRENVVLRFVGVCHLLETLRGLTTRVLATWGKGMEAIGLWYDQLLAESLGKEERGAMPLTVVNTRDLHSRGQQHQEGRRDKLITNLIVEHCRRSPLAVGRSEHNQDQLNALAEKTLPELLRAAIAGTNAAYAEDHRPTADLRLPMLNEYCLGELFQMLMLATVVEGRLIGINPYGQSGVEAYKRHMNAHLHRT